MIKVNIILMVILFTGFFVGLLYNYFSDSIQMLFPITFSMLILSIAAVSAYYLNIARFYFYGILVALAPIVGEILWKNGLATHHGFPVVFGIISFALISTGLILFVRFMHKNPPINMEN